MHKSGKAADLFARLQVFGDYQKQCTQNTHRRQRNDLALFNTYLAQAGVQRAAEDLYRDAEAWRGISYGHLKGFRTWLLNESYSTSSVNVSLATLRTYCALAFEAGTLDASTLCLIKTVTSFSHKNGRNIDAERTRNRQRTRNPEAKKATPTHVTLKSTRKLEATTISTPRSRPRTHDALLEARDSPLICLLMEHMLRCSEVTLLRLGSFDLDHNTLTVSRQKTDDTDTYELLAATHEAAETYLALVQNSEQRPTGPLFLGYKGKPITTQAINKRVGELGELAGIAHLSPHDLRHYGATNAIRSDSSLDLLHKNEVGSGEMLAEKPSAKLL